MKYVGIAAWSSEPPRELVEKARQFIDALASACGSDVVIVVGGYWGLMKHVVDRALEKGLKVVIVPPLEREDWAFPEGAIVVRTGLSFRLRSVVLVRTSDVLVVLGGGGGTLQEAFTAYTEAKPVFVLQGTGLPTDKLAAFSPYIDDRAISEVRLVEDPKELATEVCRALARAERRVSTYG